MHSAGIKGDTISYTTVINACAKVGAVEKAEAWLGRMIEEGAEPNVVTFNAVIAACAKRCDGERAVEWLDKMKRSGVRPNSFSYNSAAKPFVVKGDFRRVESLVANLRNDDLPRDDFCLASLLYAYSNAQPKQRRRAEQVFEEYAVAGVPLSRSAFSALIRAVGRTSAETLCAKCGIDWRGLDFSAAQRDTR